MGFRGTFYFDQMELNNHTVEVGTPLITADGKLFLVTALDGENSRCMALCTAVLKGEAGSVTSVNGVAPDASGNVQIETGSGISVTAQPGQTIIVREVDENGKEKLRIYIGSRYMLCGRIGGGAY